MKACLSGLASLHMHKQKKYIYTNQIYVAKCMNTGHVNTFHFTY